MIGKKVKIAGKELRVVLGQSESLSNLYVVSVLNRAIGCKLTPLGLRPYCIKGHRPLVVAWQYIHTWAMGIPLGSGRYKTYDKTFMRYLKDTEHDPVHPVTGEVLVKNKALADALDKEIPDVPGMSLAIEMGHKRIKEMIAAKSKAERYAFISSLSKLQQGSDVKTASVLSAKELSQLYTSYGLSIGDATRLVQYVDVYAVFSYDTEPIDPKELVELMDVLCSEKKDTPVSLPSGILLQDFIQTLTGSGVRKVHITLEL